MKLCTNSESLREHNTCHDETGRFCSGESLPALPGTSAIPAGTVRRFHVTKAPAETIRQQGLRMDAAKGIEGPRGVYGWDNYESALRYSSYELPIVEYYITKAEADYHPLAVQRSIRPSEIIGIHEPWHGHYRRALEDGLTPEDLDGIDEHYDRAAAALRRRRR